MPENRRTFKDVSQGLQSFGTNCYKRSKNIEKNEEDLVSWSGRSTSRTVKIRTSRGDEVFNVNI